MYKFTIYPYITCLHSCMVYIYDVCHIYFVSVLFHSFIFCSVCVLWARVKSTKMKHRKVFREWEKGDHLVKSLRQRRERLAVTFNLVFKVSSKFTAARHWKAHATHGNPYCDGRRQNLFLNNCNIIIIIRGKKNNSDINNWGSYRARVTYEGAWGFDVLSVIYKTRRYV